MSMNIGAEDGSIPANVSENMRADRHRRVGEAGGGGEVVGRADVGGHRSRYELEPLGSHQCEDQGDQTDCGDHLSEPEVSC